MPRTLLLLDAYALIYRAYFAFINRPMRNSKGFNTSAVYGFLRALLDAQRRHAPTHLAVAFDVGGDTFRSQLYPDYKANRQETPEDIRASVPVIKALLRAMGVPMVEQQGFEADDVAGTLARRAEALGFQVLMMTPDKDYGQLLSPRIAIIKPSRSGSGMETITAEAFCQGYGIQDPMQFRDILALWGDTSDNIPGVPGIGEKTAAKLIAEHQSIDNLYANLQRLTPALQHKLIHSREQLLMARQLVTIRTDVPLDVEVEALQRVSPNPQAAQPILDELEFKALRMEILGQTAQPSGLPVQTALFGPEAYPEPAIGPSLGTIDTVPHQYHLVQSEEELQALIQALAAAPEVSLDTETTGLEHHTAQLVGMSFAVRPHQAWYVPFPPDPAQARALLQRLAPILEREATVKVGQNIKFDLMVLSAHGVALRGPLLDTMLAHYLLEPDKPHGLNYLAEQLLGYRPIAIEELIGRRGPQQRNMRSVDPARVAPYACEDADIALQLKGVLWERLGQEGLTTLYHQLEEPLIRVLAHMELVGVRIDPQALAHLAQELNGELHTLDAQIKAMAGEPGLNISSPRQLGELLFQKLRLAPDAKRTKTKQYATGEEELIRYIDKHPIIGKILDHRSIRKLLSTYVEALPAQINPQTRRVHTSFNQAVAATGRLSSNSPNLQNIPIREERGREIRRAFVPTDTDHVILSADYSQIELRLMAHMSGDTSMRQAFASGEDIHTATASKIFRLPIAQVSREQRGKAKTANFGMIYGISAFGLSQRLGIGRTEAQALMESYFSTYPGVKAYMDSCAHQARAQGYVQTLYGRKRYLPDIRSSNPTVRGLAERNAINAPIQGSAADIMKAAMIAIHQAIRRENLRSRMIIQVHDELVFDVYTPELDALKTLVRAAMENVYPLAVPLVVDMGVGASWLDAH